MKIHSVLLALALVGMGGAAVAQWQWLDKDGRKVFSDRAPPPDVAEKSILKRPNSAAKAPATVVTAEEDSAKAVAAAPSLSASRPVGGVDKELEAKKRQAADAELAKRRAE